MTCLRGSLQGSMYEDTRIEFLAAGGEQTEDVEECGIEIQVQYSKNVLCVRHVTISEISFLL